MYLYIGIYGLFSHKSNDFFLIRKIFGKKISRYAANFVFLQLKYYYGRATDMRLYVCRRMNLENENGTDTGRENG